MLSVLVKAKQHWQEELRECASISELVKQDFSVAEIDLTGKGFISADDLTCFLNMNSTLELRTRDLTPMLRRFNQLEGITNLTPKITYETFLDLLTK